MAWLGTATSLLSTGLSVAGSVADGQAAAVGASFSQEHARDQAKQVGSQGASQELDLRRQNNQLLSAQAAAIAESGTGFSGTNSMIQRQDSTLAELDALNTRYQTALKINEYDNAALALAPQPSAMQRMFGKRGLGRFSTLNRQWQTFSGGGLEFNSEKGRGW